MNACHQIAFQRLVLTAVVSLLGCQDGSLDLSSSSDVGVQAMSAQVTVPVYDLGFSSYSPILEILEAGYRPKDETEDDEAFVAEWRQSCDQLSDAISQHWTIGIFNSDVFVDMDWGSDRMMCVEIGNRAILNSKFMSIASQAVNALAGDYCVDFCGSWDYLETASGAPYPRFNVFVTKKAIWVYTEDEDLLDVLAIRHVIERPPIGRERPRPISDGVE